MAIIIPIITKFLDEGLKQANAEFGKAEQEVGKTQKAFEKLAGPARAVTVAMVGAGVAVAKNAGGSLKAQKKLAASLDAVGYKEHAAEMSAYADEMQHVIGISDEDIQASMQKIAAYDQVAKSTDLMKRATQGAADMSAAGFGTMESAATALGRALQDPARNLGALTRMGVTFTQQQRDQIKAMTEAGDVAGAQAIIMGEVEDTFGGVAETSASGSAKMKLAWDEAAEALGTSLAPILGIIIELLKKLAGFVTENADVVMALAIAITVLAAGVVAINAAFKIYQATMKAATLAMKVFGITSKAAMGWIGLLIAVVVAAAVLIIANWDKIKDYTIKVWNAIKSFMSKFIAWIKNAFKVAWDWLKKIVQTGWDFIKRILRLNPFIFVLTHLDWIKEKVRAAFDWVKTKISNVWNAIKGIFKTNPFAAIEGFVNKMKAWIGDAFDWVLNKIETIVGKVQGAVDKVKSAFDKVKSMGDNLPKPGGKGAPLYATVVPRALAAPAIRSLLGGVPAPTEPVVVRDGGGPNVQITVTGALDPEQVARQVQKILDSHNRRQGRTILRPVAF